MSGLVEQIADFGISAKLLRAPEPHFQRVIDLICRERAFESSFMCQLIGMKILENLLHAIPKALQTIRLEGVVSKRLECQRRARMKSQESRRIAVTLADDAENNVESAQIADKLIATLREIEEVLCPVIGKGGVAALFRRSLYLTARSFPELAVIHAGDATAMDPAALKSELAQQTNVVVAEFGIGFLQTLDEVMTSLVGSLLTERLLRPVWSKLSIKTPAQDDHP